MSSVRPPVVVQARVELNIHMHEMFNKLVSVCGMEERAF